MANSAMAAMEILVKGKGVAIKNAGDSGRKHIYPIPTRTAWENERFMDLGKYHIFDYRTSAIRDKNYATTPVGADYFTAVAETRDDYSLDSFTANEAGTVTIALPDDNLSAAGWSKVAGDFKTSIQTYYTYRYDYTRVGEEVSIPKTDKDHPTLLFADNGEIKFSNPLPISSLANGVKIADARNYFADPSIIVLPNGDYVATGRGGPLNRVNNKTVFVRMWLSKDKGKTWAPLNEENIPLRHPTAFHHEGALYVLGDMSGSKGKETGGIQRSTDGGKTWSDPVDLGFNFRTAPSHVVIAKGRIWCQSELATPGRKVVSAPVDSDLMDPKSWISATDTGKDWSGNEADLMNTRGNDYPILMSKGDKIARVFSATSYGTNNPGDDLNLPVSGSKYTAQYDPVSDKYYALTSYSSLPGNIRTGIGLFVSNDGQDFKLLRQVMTGESTAFHGFNYPFMQIDGNDIVFVSRTAWENQKGIAQRWHDANMFTFHRISNFRGNQASQPDAPTTAPEPANEEPANEEPATESTGDQAVPPADGGMAAQSGAKTLVVRRSNLCVDVHSADVAPLTNVEQFSCHGKENQLFSFVNEDNGWYQIQAQHSGQCLDVEEASTANGANVVQWSCKSADVENQQFKLESKGDGWFNLVARHSGLCLDISENSTGDGANMQQSDCSNASNQQFRFQ